MTKVLKLLGRGSLIAWLLVILVAFAVFTFTWNGGVAHAQNATNDTVVTISDLAITNANNGVDVDHPPGLAAPIAFPDTWATIEKSLDSATNAAESYVLRDNRYVIVSDPATTAAAADITDSSVLGTIANLDSNVMSIAIAASLAVLVITLVSTTAIGSFVDFTAHKTQSFGLRSAASRKLGHTNVSNNWLTARLAVSGTTITTITAGQGNYGIRRVFRMSFAPARAAGHSAFSLA